MAELTSPIPNRFRAFNNMTYGVSLYLQDPKHYAEMVEFGKKDVTGLELLVQSGGASTAPGSAAEQTGNFGAKRNKFFTRDFYLDDIQLQSYIAGTTTGGPQNSFELNFTVTEPMGLTFMERLNNASTTYAREVLKIDNFNPINQIYLAVIRFYGYDNDGKQVLNGKFEDSSDPEAYVEKWIPFMIKQVSFAVETSKVVYQCQCVCPQSQIGLGQVNGTIPFNIGLQGKTLKDILDGTDKIDSTGGSVVQGLMATLNQHQKKLASDKKYDHPNVYAIEFEEGAKLDKAAMSALGTSQVSRSATAAGMPTGASSQASTGTAKTIKGVQTLSANAGMKIIKFIDLAIRSSTYMSAQYKKISDANKDKSTKHKPSEQKPLNWFKIRPRVEVIAFDSKRQAWAYKITYVVTVYPVASVETNDFTSERCFRPHKEYDFWFTGNNTEVLNFRQDYNSFYFTTFDSKHKEDPTVNPKTQTNIRAQKVYRPTSSEAQTGENSTDEQAANAASILYAPQDIANCEIDILGDPDWLSQSELFYAANKKGPGDAILDDGSINYDKSEVYFTVNFNTVVDYDLDTGLADVTQKNVTENLDGSHPGGVSQYAFVYRANTITSQFEKGKFTQKLVGTLVFIPDACITGKKPANEV